jgi:hypothetical protein
MRKKEVDIPYHNAVSNGVKELFDYFHKFSILENYLRKEEKRIKGSSYVVGLIALRSSIIILQFTMLETIVNFLSELIIQTNKGLKGAPKVVNSLSQAEIDFLAEQRTFIETKTGELKIKSQIFVSTLDKLTIVPFLFSKLHGINFRLKKSDKGWQNVVRLKELRDQLTHVKLNFSSLTTKELTKSDVASSITDKDLFCGFEALRWYLLQIIDLLFKIYKQEFKKLIEGFYVLDFSCWTMLAKLCKKCKISEKTFQREHKRPTLIDLCLKKVKKR